MGPTQTSVSFSGRGERGGVCVRVCRGKIIPSLSRNLLKCAWAFKGSPIVSKWNMVVNKQLLLTQLWVVRGVCFSVCCWSVLTSSSRLDTFKQVDVCGERSKGKNHKSLIELLSDALGAALAGGKELLAKRKASFGRPVAFSSAMIGRTFGSFPLIMPNFCRKMFDFSLH